MNTFHEHEHNHNIGYKWKYEVDECFRVRLFFK